MYIIVRTKVDFIQNRLESKKIEIDHNFFRFNDRNVLICSLSNLEIKVIKYIESYLNQHLNILYNYIKPLTVFITHRVLQSKHLLN